MQKLPLDISYFLLAIGKTMIKILRSYEVVILLGRLSQIDIHYLATL
jgi:hypothetical protein